MNRAMRGEEPGWEGVAIGRRQRGGLAKGGLGAARKAARFRAGDDGLPPFCALRPPSQRRRNERVAARDGTHARQRPMQSWAADLYRTEARGSRKIVRAEIVGRDACEQGRRGFPIIFLREAPVCGNRICGDFGRPAPRMTPVRLFVQISLGYFHRVPVEVIGDCLPEVIGTIQSTMLNNL